MSKKAEKRASEKAPRRSRLFVAIDLSILAAAAAFIAISLIVRYTESNTDPFSTFLVDNADTFVSALTAALGSTIILLLFFRRFEKLKDNQIVGLLQDALDGKAAGEDPVSGPVLSRIHETSVELETLRAEKARLENEVAELTEKSRNAVMRSLSARINPAMLKKSLDGLNKMASENRCEDIAALSEDISQVITASIEDGAETVSLADELSRIKRYLEAQEIMDGRRYRCRMSIMCNIVNYRVLPNLILPVVQAMFDAAEAPEDYDYEMCVEATSSSSNMLVILRDNSVNSFVDEKTGEISNSLTELDENSRGLSAALLNRRIELYYGEKYGIKISSTKLGNTICIYLPPQAAHLL